MNVVKTLNLRVMAGRIAVDCDAVFASQIAFASTLCSILTIPLLTLVMESFPL